MCRCATVTLSRTSIQTSWTPLHLHIAAKHYHVNAVPLTTDRLQAGQTAKVQLVSDEPICAMTGDRFIIRNPLKQRKPSVVV